MEDTENPKCISFRRLPTRDSCHICLEYGYVSHTCYKHGTYNIDIPTEYVCDDFTPFVVASREKLAYFRKMGYA